MTEKKEQFDFSEEELKQMEDKLDDYQEKQLSGNTKQVLEAKAKEDETKQLQSDFKEFVNSLPRKSKRRVFEHRKFGNQLMSSFRRQNLARLQKGSQ